MNYDSLVGGEGIRRGEQSGEQLLAAEGKRAKGELQCRGELREGREGKGKKDRREGRERGDLM